MKEVSKVVSVLLAAILAVMCVPFAAAAEETESKTLDVFCYNVAGLPDFSSFTGGDAKDVPGNQSAIGAYLNDNNLDIVAVQEDFGYHDNLTAPMTSYAYRTISTGSIPYGDGMNIFTKTMPINNETRIGWNQLYGIIDDGADEFSSKGFMYTVIEIESGVYIDFINLHADAYGDAGSVAARTDNFKQLAAFINNLNTGRPLIVTGDFNTSLHADVEHFYDNLIAACSLKDAWAEVCNGGSYTDFTYWANEYGYGWSNYWGKWDSVEHFLYRSGTGVTLDAESFEYVTVKNGDVSASDHNACHAVFSYTVSEGYTDGGNVNVVKEAPIGSFIDKLVKLFKAIWLAITNFDTILNYLKK